MLMTVHGTTPRFSSIEVQHCTALIVTSVCFIQSSITAPSFAIFSSAASGISLVVTYFLIAASFACARVVVVLHARDAAEDFGQVERLDRDPIGLQNPLASSEPY